MTLTVADYFCGAGGSSSGMEQVPGVRVVMAANHWQLAIDTHNANLPHADHDTADIAAIDPRRHPKTDIGWFSPECTNWSVARGKKVDYDGKPVQLDLFSDDEPPLPDEAAVRSRMLMQDVPRFTEVHRYRAVLVENVTDVLMWEHLDEWLTRMDKLDYRHRIVVLNSAFASALGPGAPQLRDRVYFVFWRVKYGVARPAVEHPLVTFAASGTHQGIVMRNNTGGAEMSTPLDEPLRTLTTLGHQSLVRWDHLYEYDTGQLRSLNAPMPAQTTVQGDALLGTAIAVEDCTFRMLEVDEIRAGMAFADGYILLGTKRERVRLLGNAVTPPAARDLVAAVVEAITGDELEPAA